LEILVVVPPDEEGDMLARELLRTRSGVRRMWPPPPSLPEAVDVMFCELIPELPQCLPWVPGQPMAALVVVTQAVQMPQLKLLRNCAPHAVLHRPFTTGAVLTSLAIARAQFLYEQRLRTRIDKLDETLRAFRSVERAKNILMEKRNLDEEEAYHFMRRQAMSQRISIGAVAVAIIDSHDILG
jgi:AmiR/NasT family two-component response regulator